MDIIKLGSFTLEPFDYDNMGHRYVSVVLDNDVSFHDYVGECQYLVENAKIRQESGLNDQVYVVKNNEEYIGILSLIILHGNPYLTIGVIPERQGCHYGKNILKEYIEYLFLEYPEYGEVFASIHPKNERSINNVLKLGFVSVSQTKYVKTRE